MLIFVAATLGVCLLVITWALGLTADVGGLIALAVLGIGILASMVTRGRGDEDEAI